MSQYAKRDFPSSNGMDNALILYILGSTRVEVVNHTSKECNSVLSEIWIHLQQAHACRFLGLKNINQLGTILNPKPHGSLLIICRLHILPLHLRTSSFSRRGVILWITDRLNLLFHKVQILNKYISCSTLYLLAMNKLHFI